MDREESDRERERDGEISFTHTPDYVYKCGRKRERDFSIALVLLGENKRNKMAGTRVRS